VVDYGCYWFSEECVPYEPFSIEFNNPLDESAFSEDLISVSPEIPGMTINGYGSFIVISGETGGQTTYTVTISKDLQDEFGQRLGKDEKLIFKVGKADPRLIGPEKYFVTLDPSSRKPVFQSTQSTTTNLRFRSMLSNLLIGRNSRSISPIGSNLTEIIRFRENSCSMR